MKIFKWIGITIGLLILLAVLGISLFIYKAKYGINFYDTTPHEITEKPGEKSVLIITKTNGFRHGEAIEASSPLLSRICRRQGWTPYVTDDTGIFNKEQLDYFDVVVFNNCTGKILNPSQRNIFKNYIENGGGFVGIHGAGDDSHQWEWYENELIAAHFSHHPIDPPLQKAKVRLNGAAIDPLVFREMPAEFEHTDEWYVFFDNAKDNGATVLYSLDESGITMDGSIPLLAPNKDFGMDGDHPIVWFKPVGKGRSFYCGMGHHGDAYKNEALIDILVKGIKWAGGFQKTNEMRMLQAPTQ